MLSRKFSSFQLQRSPSIKSCFPETKSTYGLDYTPFEQFSTCFHVDNNKSKESISIQDISHHDTSLLTSINVESSSSVALQDKLQEKSDYPNNSLSDVQKLNIQLLPASQNVTVLQTSKLTQQYYMKDIDIINMAPNWHLDPVDPIYTLVNQVRIATTEQSVEAPSDAAGSALATVPHSGKMQRQGMRHVPLYLAALKGDWKTAKIYLKLNPQLVCAQITRGSETALHVAAGARHTLFVEELVKLMSKDDLALQNKVGNTALCFAAASGIPKIAKVMVDKNRNLPLIRGSKGATPLYMAVLLGKRDMVWYLFSVTNDSELSVGDHVGLLIAAITANLFDVALHIIERHPELAITRDGNGETALHVLSRKPTAFYSGSQLGLWQRCIYSCLHVEVQPDYSSSTTNHGNLTQMIIRVLSTLKFLLWKALEFVVPGIKLIHNTKLMHIQALELVKQLWQQILFLDYSDVRDLIRTPRRLLFTAAELGIVEFITVLIRSYPDLIWSVDEQSRSIFHIAVAHRQEKVFNLIYEIGALKDFIAVYKDENDNNLLHLAGKLPPSNRLSTDSGAALQLQRELLWFKGVEKIVQPLYTEMENSEGQTPNSLFSEEHKGLVQEGEKWMKDTASSCMVVATLIATVMFAAAFTVPGGNNNDTGMPIFLQKWPFMVFAISDALALFSSATSILVFLSILTSRYAEEDFLGSLPNRLIIGLATLFVSITAMMIAYSATLFIVLGHGLAWVAIPIAIAACIPVLLFALLHFPLVADIICHTYRSSISFRPNNQMFC